MSEAPSISKQDYKEIIEDFLSNQPFTVFPATDKPLEDTILRRCLSYNIPEKEAKMLASHGPAAAKQFYPFHSAPVQHLIAIYVAWLGAVDDLGEDFLEELRKFGHNTIQNIPQTAILQNWADLLQEVRYFYSDFCANRVINGTISYIDACVFEIESSQNFQKLSTAPDFPDYFRVMTGLAEPFTYFILPNDLVSKERLDLFIQAAPELMLFTNSVNDLLSFYKESIVSNERGNLVYLRAAKDGLSVKEVLRSLVFEIQRCAKDIRSTVAEDEKLYCVVDAYLKGYIGFHVSQYRYKLRELDLSSLKDF